MATQTRNGNWILGDVVRVQGMPGSFQIIETNPPDADENSVAVAQKVYHGTRGRCVVSVSKLTK